MTFIQSLFDHKNPLPTEISTYKEMLEHPDFTEVAPQIYQLLKKQGKLSEVPDFFQQHIKDEFNKSVYQNFFIKNQTEQLLKTFEGACIEVIPLKGPIFAEKYFGHIGARPTSDIDLFIKLSNLEKAKELVISQGFSVEEDTIPDHFHWCFSKKLPGSEIALTVELHWDLLRQDRSRLDLTEIWNQATSYQSTKYVKELSHYHTFYFICIHSWRHNLNSLKHFVDIIQLIHILKDELDYSRLLHDAKTHQTAKRIIRTLTIVYQMFTHLQDIKEFHLKRQNLIVRNFPFSERNQNRFRKYVDFIDYQYFSYDTWKHCLTKLINWFFPSRYDISYQNPNGKKVRYYTIDLVLLYKKRLFK
jgi:hypothetical protein